MDTTQKHACKEKVNNHGRTQNAALDQVWVNVPKASPTSRVREVATTEVTRTSTTLTAQ